MLLAAAASSFAGKLEVQPQNGLVPIKQITGSQFLSISRKQFVLKATSHYTVYLNQNATSDETLTLYDTAGILSMPTTITIAAGTGQKGFTVVPLDTGSTTLTAVGPVNTVTLDVSVGP